MVSLERRWEEKRAHPRIAIDFPVRAAPARRLVPLLPLWPAYRGALCDASREGLQIRIDKECLAGGRLKLWIDTLGRQGWRTVVLRGTVAWAAPEENGTCRLGIRIQKWPKRYIHLWREVIVEILTLRGG